MTPFLMPLTQVTLAGSCYTTVALTVERYISGTDARLSHSSATVN